MISIPGRIPVYIFPFFWFLIFMIGWLNSNSIYGTAIWAVVIFFSVLIHEYGHALTAVFFGQRAEINLVGLGGLTKRNGPALSKWKEFIIVLNGPLAGFALFFLAFFLSGYVKENEVLRYALRIALNVNLFWTILNLLPVFPLDGGHLMRILLEGTFGVRGLKATFFLSIIFGTLFALYFFSIQQVLVGALFLMLSFESYRGWSDVKNFTPDDSDENLKEILNKGLDNLRQGRTQEALEQFLYVRDQSSKGVLYVNATQYAARILAEQGQYKKAYDWLFPLKNRISIEYLRLLQQLAYRVQEWEEAVKLGQQAYQQEPSIETAQINALSYAIMGDATPAVGWLRSLSLLGVQDIHKIIERTEFDSIRSSPIFQNWLKSLKK